LPLGLEPPGPRALTVFTCAAMTGAGLVPAVTGRHLLAAALAQLLPPLVALLSLLS
jgi:hypothetical protein